MTSIASLVAAILSAVAPSVLAQSGPADPFNGTWRLNAAKSTAMWQAQPQPKSASPRAMAHEVITMRIASGTMDYRVEYEEADHGRKTATYRAQFNDAAWEDIRGEAEGGLSALTLVKIDDRLHYWVTRTKDGAFGGLIQRRLADDGRSFTSVSLGSDGYVQYVRVYEKS